MSDRDKQKGYIPWHDKIDEELILELAKQFVNSVYQHGMKLRIVNVKWFEEGKFDVETLGEPLVKAVPDKDEHVH